MTARPTNDTAPTLRRVCLYVRVSTTGRSRRGDVLAYDQDSSVQEQPLRQLAAQRRWVVTQSIPTAPVEPRSAALAWTPSWPTPGTGPSMWS
jgi:hypothetical protein